MGSKAVGVVGRPKVAAEKAEWRRRFRDRRAQAGPAALARASAQIVGRLRALPEVEGAGVVHLFWPLPGEVDLRPLAEALRARGATIALPAVAGGRTLVHRRYLGAAHLVPGRWGTSEPGPDAPAIRPDEIDVVVVPGLAFGRDGGRLGAGGGYYDTFLAGTGAARLGVCPGWALVDAVPTEPHDARMDAVVTEAAVVRAAR